MKYACSMDTGFQDFKTIKLQRTEDQPNHLERTKPLCTKWLSEIHLAGSVCNQLGCDTGLQDFTTIKLQRPEDKPNHLERTIPLCTKWPSEIHLAGSVCNQLGCDPRVVMKAPASCSGSRYLNGFWGISWWTEHMAASLRGSAVPPGP